MSAQPTLKSIWEQILSRPGGIRINAPSNGAARQLMLRLNKFRKKNPHAIKGIDLIMLNVPPEAPYIETKIEGEAEADSFDLSAFDFEQVETQYGKRRRPPAPIRVTEDEQPDLPFTAPDLSLFDFIEGMKDKETKE